MAFPVPLAVVLSGASVSQLQHWRSTNLLQPEYREGRTVIYSFRDLVALRTFVRLRAKVPLQRIRKAMSSLQDFDLTKHPSSYQLTTDGSTVFLLEGEKAIDLVGRRGQHVLLTLADVYEPFETRQGRSVVDFRHPRPLLEVSEGRMDGWPTIRGTRVPYDSVAQLAHGEITPDLVPRHYPTVTPEAVLDALDFYHEVEGIRRGRAA